MAKQKIVRNPVVAETQSADVVAGMKRPRAYTAKYDPVKAKIAKKVATGAGGFGESGGRQREAGMMIDFVHMSAPYSSGYKLDTYRSSYAFGLGDRTGAYDVPTYFLMMNQQNGGLLYWPVTLAEKYSWYRYWSRCIYLGDNDLGLISMADGTTKSIKDVQVGDQVITGSGTIRSVKNKFERRCIEDRAVTLKAWCLQNHLKTTHHHPYWIIRKENVKKDDAHRLDEPLFKPDWVQAEDVKPGDYVLFAPMRVENPSSVTPEQARFLGYYAAEGSIAWGTRCVGTTNDEKRGNGWKWHQEKVKVPDAVTFSLHKDEEDTIGKKIIELAKSVFNVDAKIIRRRKNAIEIMVSGRDVGEFCFYHVGCYSQHKKLSGELVHSSEAARREFIIAYAEGDGHQYGYEDDKNRAKILIGTTSESMASQVQVMAISIGIMCRVASYDRTPDSGFKSDTKQIQIIIPSWSANKLIESTDCKWNKIKIGISEDHYCAFFINGYAAFKVKEVAFSQEDDTVYNIEVDAEGDEKSYICNGMVTHNSDAYVGRALELLTDLPMSKLTLNMPKMPKAKRALQKEILEFFTYQLDILGMFELCQDILWEYNCIGNTYLFCEWSDEKKMWSRIVMLPPEEVYIFQYPFSDNKRVEYRPERLVKMIRDGATIVAGQSAVSATEGNTCARADLEQKILENLPQELVEMVRTEGCIVMDTDPTTGSFVHHFARRRSPYMDLGVSVLERVLVPMLQKEHYKYCQLSLASRNMTPKNLITAPGLMPEEVDALRTQVDLSYLDPEYSVITNYEVNWQQIGTTDRLIDLDREYERIENQVFAALGVTRELLTGEGTFTGSKVTVEILNTMFLMSREILKSFIEKKLFIPICEAHGWYEEGKNGVKKYIYPNIGFNRLTIRDNAEVFDSLFQLYQKGSLPVDILYELFNLNTDEINARLRNQLFTVRDSTSNRMSEEVNAEVGRKLVDTTDIVERVARYLGVKMKPQQQDQSGGMGGAGGAGGAGGFQQGFTDLKGEAGTPPVGEDGGSPVEPVQDEAEPDGEEGSGEKPASRTDQLADAIAENLPPEADEHDVEQIVEKVSELDSK